MYSSLLGEDDVVAGTAAASSVQGNGDEENGRSRAGRRSKKTSARSKSPATDTLDGDEPDASQAPYRGDVI